LRCLANAILLRRGRSVDALFLTGSSPRRIRQRNEVAALQALCQSGPLTRADLARELRLNRSSSGHIIAALAADGLVREARDGASSIGGGSGKAGRPGIRLELVPDARCFIGVEIGVEHITVVEIDLAANLVLTRVEPFDGPSTSVERAVALAVGLALDVVPEASLARCEGFGVSTPAQMDSLGFVRIAPLLGWQDVHLTDLVRSALPLRAPVVAENDANAFAFGASYRRSGLRSGVTLCLVMESGVGGGVVIEGKLFRGAHGVAGEIGHLLVSDAFGPRRNLEQVIGLGTVMDRYREIASKPPVLANLLVDVRSGFAPAVAIAEQWGKSLAYGLVQACRVIDPDQIVLGGSLAALYAPIADRVMEDIRLIQEASFPLPSIIVDLDAGAGPAFGAACLLHQRYLSLESQRLIDAPTRDETAIERPAPCP